MSQKNGKKNDQAQDISEILRLLKQSVESDRAASAAAEKDKVDEKKDSEASEFSYSMEGFLDADESDEDIASEDTEENTDKESAEEEAADGEINEDDPLEENNEESETVEDDVAPWEDESSVEDDRAPWEDESSIEAEQEDLEIEIADAAEREFEEDDEDPWFSSGKFDDISNKEADDGFSETYESKREDEIADDPRSDDEEAYESVEDIENTENISADESDDDEYDVEVDEALEYTEPDEDDDAALTVDAIDEVIAEIERERSAMMKEDDEPSWYQEELEKPAPAERDDRKENDEAGETFFDFNDFAYVTEEELANVEKERAERNEYPEYSEESDLDDGDDPLDDEAVCSEEADDRFDDSDGAIRWESEDEMLSDDMYDEIVIVRGDENADDEIYDESYEDESYEDESYEDESYDDESYEDESYDDESYEDEVVTEEDFDYEDEMIADDSYEQSESDIDKELKEAEEENDDDIGLDETDIHLLSKLGYSPVGASEEVVKQNDRENLSKESSGDIAYDYEGEEYIFEKQREEIRAGYSVAKKSTLTRLAIAGGATFLLLIYETLVAFGVTLPWLFNQHTYALSHIMISLQFLIIAGAMSIRSVVKGVADAACMKATPQSVSAVVIIMNVLYSIVIAIITPEDYVLFNFAGALAAVLAIGYEYLNLVNESHAFDVVALKDDVRYVFGEDEKLYEVFGEPAPSLRAYSTDFNKHYFAKMKRRTVSYKYLSTLIVAVLALMLVVGVISLLATGTPGEALRNAIMIVNFALPLGILGAYTLPMLKVTKAMLGKNAALIGQATVDKYVNTRFVTFDEEDLFPSIKTTHIDLKPSGNHDISAVLRKTGKLFSAIGGPMKKLVEIPDASDGDDVIIKDIFDDGVSATVESSEMLVGSARFLEINGVDPTATSDYRDADGNNEVLYVAINGSLAARYYIKYLPDPDFVKAVNKLGDKRIAVGIKTCNPGINSNIILRRCPEMKYKIYAIKSGYDSADELESHRVLTDGDLISVKKSVFLAYPLLACLALKKYYKSDAVFRWVSAAVGALVALCIALAGRGLDINSLGIAIYQLLWFAPSLAAALIDFRSAGAEGSKHKNTDSTN